MSGVLDPFRFVLIAVAGWMNQRQLQGHRLPSRRESYSARATRRAPLAAQRRPAPSIGRQGQGFRTEAFGGGGHHCDARNLARLASQTDRPEVRREWTAW